MTAVRIAHAEPWPGRLREGGFAITEFLVVLAGADGDRALPLWLPGSDGDALWQVLAEELAARMLGRGGRQRIALARLHRAARSPSGRRSARPGSPATPGWSCGSAPTSRSGPPAGRTTTPAAMPSR
jgi:hypothetical protein